MLRDKSADQRLDLERQIGQKEQRYDELAQEKRSIKHQLETFQNQMEYTFRHEEEHYETFKATSDPLGWQSTVFREVRRAIQQITARQSEQLEQDYRTENTQLQDEIESLHRERNTLPWD